MEKVLLLKFGELFLKGKNKKEFEKCLLENIQRKLSAFSFSIEQVVGRIIISSYDEMDENLIVQNLTTVFGLVGVSKAIKVYSSMEKIVEYISKIQINGTFRVNAKRADKKFALTSVELERKLGEVILENNYNAKVDLHHPEHNINIEVRFNNETFIYYETIKCEGGLPLGSGGKAILLLSGGIDSPVAGYLMSKRGLKLEAVHFHSYPYTSEQAKEKVITLAKRLTKYCDEIKLHIVSFTKIQEQIHMNCDEEYMITIMRRIMMRIAEKICKQNELGAIITGESLGQVASQTIQSINVTNSVVSLPVFRPVIAFDKEDIVEIAKKIGTFETSILPYEDCCTVFLPKHPVIKPTIKKVEYQEEFLDIESLVNEALATKEEMVIKR